MRASLPTIFLALSTLVSPLAGCQSSPESAEVAYSDITEAAPSAPAARGEAGAAVPISATPGGDALGRDLVRTATLVLRADDHSAAVARAREAARRLGGTVTDEASRRYDTRVETELTLRVPATRFDTLLAVLGTVPGTLESRTVAVEDVTRPVADTEARLRVRRAAEERLLDLLDDAESVEEVLAVQTRLDAVREEIESAEAALRVLRAGVAMSTVRLTVYEASAAGLAAGPGWGTRAGRAVTAGWDGLLEALIVVAALWPLWLAVAAGAWGLRAWRRRRARRTPPLPARPTEPSPRAATWSS